jgi:hypothetical protein
LASNSVPGKILHQFIQADAGNQPEALQRHRGGSQHDGPRKAGEALLATATKLLAPAQPTKDSPLPKEGRTRFYFLTLDGAYTAEAQEEELGNGRHPSSPLF